jgi:hypothetical protein
MRRGFIGLAFSFVLLALSALPAQAQDAPAQPQCSGQPATWLGDDPDASDITAAGAALSRQMTTTAGTNPYAMFRVTGDMQPQRLEAMSDGDPSIRLETPDGDLLADIDPSAEFLEDAEVREVEIAARRKSQSYTPAEADAARARYDALKGLVIPKGTQSAPAHKAWVTIREWEAAAQRGEWTHRWSVQFRLGTQMFAEAQRAVHPRQAANAMALFIRDLRKSHHQVEVVAKLVEAI